MAKRPIRISFFVPGIQFTISVGIFSLFFLKKNERIDNKRFPERSREAFMNSVNALLQLHALFYMSTRMQQSNHARAKVKLLKVGWRV